jgi:hypothetical protein
MTAWSSLSVPKPSVRTQVVLQRVGQLASVFRLIVVLKALLGLYRHVYAYGIIGTGTQVYLAIKNVSTKTYVPH